MRTILKETRCSLTERSIQRITGAWLVLSPSKKKVISGLPIKTSSWERIYPTMSNKQPFGCSPLKPSRLTHVSSEYSRGGISFAVAWCTLNIRNDERGKFDLCPGRGGCDRRNLFVL